MSTRPRPAGAPVEGPTLEFSTVMANAVHDMKNAIGMLIGAVDDLADRCPPGACPVTGDLADLRYQGRRINRRLVELLALYRMEGSGYPLGSNEHEVDELLADCADECAGVLAARGIALEVRCDDGLRWFFDRGLVASVVNAAVDNAFKHARGHIRLAARVEERHLRVTVEDDGPGYPDAMLDAAGLTGTRIDAGTGATGLGLYFSSRVAAMHRSRTGTGHVSTDNRGIEGGARFTLCLP